MGCLCTTYEVNRSKRDGAMEWKRQNLQTTCGTLTFDLLTQKWCATHRHLMGCLCTTYEVNQSKRNGATEQTRQNLPTTRVTLTFVFLTQKWCATPDHYISTAQVGYAQGTAHVRAANNAILWRMVGVFIYNAWAAYMPNLYICLILKYIQSKTRWDCCS